MEFINSLLKFLEGIGLNPALKDNPEAMKEISSSVKNNYEKAISHDKTYSFTDKVTVERIKDLKEFQEVLTSDDLEHKTTRMRKGLSKYTVKDGSLVISEPKKIKGSKITSIKKTLNIDGKSGNLIVTKEGDTIVPQDDRTTSATSALTINTYDQNGLELQSSHISQNTTAPTENIVVPSEDSTLLDIVTAPGAQNSPIVEETITRNPSLATEEYRMDQSTDGHLLDRDSIIDTYTQGSGTAPLPLIGNDSQNLAKGDVPIITQKHQENYLAPCSPSTLESYQRLSRPEYIAKCKGAFHTLAENSQPFVEAVKNGAKTNPNLAATIAPAKEDEGR